MADKLDKTIRRFAKAVADEKDRGTKPYDTVAEVTRIDGKNAWVHIPGGIGETPVAMTISAGRGDLVQVRVANGQAWITGNASSPPTDDALAKKASSQAIDAFNSAASAVQSATIAKESADSALESANIAKQTTDEIVAYAASAEKTVTQILDDGETAGVAAQEAKTAADTAFTNLSQVQSVLEVAEWIATHGTYTKATTFNPNATYYTITATQVASPSDDDKDSQGVLIYYELSSGVYVRTTDTRVQSGKTYYTVTGTPVVGAKAEDIAQYYTLAVTEAMANYIKSHLALTDDGLYVMQDNSNWKLLVASNGVYIIDPEGAVVNQMKFSQNVIGKEISYHVNIDEDSIDFMNGEDLLGYIANSKLNFPVGEITKQFYVAEKYVWRQTTTGALGLYLR